MKQEIFLFFVILNVCIPAAGQLQEKEFVDPAFTHNQLINGQTTKIQSPGSWFFKLQHRFGQTGLDSSFYQQFFGLDLPSVIRFSFGKSINDRLYIEAGRSNHLKTIDLEVKYLLTRQTKDFKMPVSAAAYLNIGWRTEKFPPVPEGGVFGGTNRPFTYKSTHRFSYNSQIILSSRLNDKLSVQVAPVFVYQNLVPAGYDNLTVTLTGGGRYKTGLISSLLFEYAYVLNNRFENFHNPFSAGIEFATAGHIFQVFLSTAARINETHIYSSSATDLSDGKFLIGFNLQRNFWKKQK